MQTFYSWATNVKKIANPDITNDPQRWAYMSSVLWPYWDGGTLTPPATPSLTSAQMDALARGSIDQLMQ